MGHRILEQQSIDFAPVRARIQAPTLIGAGEHGVDRMDPVESTLRDRDMIPVACHARIPRTGHLGLVTNPELFGGIVGRFAAQA
jgi:pimeloyl-ACP methyl ester carboxylesterase